MWFGSVSTEQVRVDNGEHCRAGQSGTPRVRGLAAGFEQRSGFGVGSEADPPDAVANRLDLIGCKGLPVVRQKRAAFSVPRMSSVLTSGWFDRNLRNHDEP